MISIKRNGKMQMKILVIEQERTEQQIRKYDRSDQNGIRVISDYEELKEWWNNEE